MLITKVSFEYLIKNRLCCTVNAIEGKGIYVKNEPNLPFYCYPFANKKTISVMNL